MSQTKSELSGMLTTLYLKMGEISAFIIANRAAMTMFPTMSLNQLRYY